MKKLFNKRFILPSLVSLIVIFLFIFISTNGDTIYNNVMNNSVSSSYYYCSDSTYILKGNKCIKNEYSDQLLVGDANLDGVFDITDATFVQLYINSKINFDESSKLVSDVNKDGIINEADLNMIQRSISLSSIKGNPNSSTDYSKYNIGIDTVCLDGYSKINGRCVKRIVVDAIKVDFIYGDINSDSKIDESDTNILSNYLNGSYILNDIQLKIADMNQDGMVDISDLDIINSHIFENDKNSISINLSSSNDLNSVVNDSKVEFKADFNTLGNRKYYYKWFDVKKTDNVVETDCKAIPDNRIDTYRIIATDNNEYVLLKVYNDSNCSTQINFYKSDEIKIKEEASRISFDYKILSPILTTNIVNKNTELKLYGKFNLEGSKDYYYKWNIYKNDILSNNSNCVKVIDDIAINPIMKIDAKDTYGVFNIYSDNSCTTLINTYETEKYNYYADSISLNANSSRLSVGSSLKLKPTIKSNINNAVDYVKWSSSNTSVATVDNNGLVTAIKKGSAEITATIGNLSSTAIITVVDTGDDTSIECPMLEYDKNGDTTTITVNKNSTFNKYDVYLSTNNQTGYWAKFEKLNENIIGSSKFTNRYNGEYSNQAKIVVYNDYGISRNCYTAPLTWKYYTGSYSAKCPAFEYKYDYVSGAKNYDFQYDGFKTKSGINKVYVAFNLDNNYQYSWYTSNRDNSYKLFKTYSTSSKNVEPSVTGQLYNRNGQVVVTDKQGNSIICKTAYINNLNLEKQRVNSVDVYSEKGFSSSDKNSVIAEMKKMNNESPSYLAATSLFLLKAETYLASYGGSCGNYRVISNLIVFSESKNRDNGTSCGGSSNSAYYKGSIKHEFVHSMDSMNERLTGSSLNSLTYNNKTFKSYVDKYNINKKQCNGNFCLRYRDGYTYGVAYNEFIADLIAYDSSNFKINNELLNLRKQVLDKYFTNYKNNKTKFNQIKESFK